MPVLDSDLQRAAGHYARLLNEVAGTPAVLDLVQLGVGDDGHTASLIPGDAALAVSDADVAVTGLYRGWRRMTLTFPVINRARHVLWMAAGQGKAAAIARLMRADPSIPASHVRRDGALLLVERAALAAIPE
jgi:6-phosphogluconolactonase